MDTVIKHQSFSGFRGLILWSATPVCTGSNPVCALKSSEKLISGLFLLNYLTYRSNNVIVTSSDVVLQMG